jgi:hypothetical protein
MGLIQVTYCTTAGMLWTGNMKPLRRTQGMMIIEGGQEGLLLRAGAGAHQKGEPQIAAQVDPREPIQQRMLP